jgi:hypothetical protein
MVRSAATSACSKIRWGCSSFSTVLVVQWQQPKGGLSTAFGQIQSSVEQLKPGPLTLACSWSIMM